MSELFIPPQGAMQFEVLRGWQGESIPGWMRQEDLIVWVHGKRPVNSKNFKPDCPHADAWIVIPESVSAAMKKAGCGRSGWALCECVGRIIE